MLRKYLKHLGNLIDNKLNNWTVMVVIISIFVTFTWFFSNWVNANLTANIMQSQKNIDINQYIVIGGKKYEIVLKEVK